MRARFRIEGSRCDRERACRPGRRPWFGLGLALLVAGLMTGCSECEEDYDCPGAQVCDRAEGVCVAFVCGRDEDCPPSQSCLSNTCTPNPSMPAPDAPDAVIIRPGAQ